MEKLEQLPELVNLKEHYRKVAKLHLRELFAKDPQRFENFSLKAAGLLLDYSKNRITPHTIDLLCKLANARKLPEKIAALASGEPINTSENHAALHTALRDTTSASIWLNQQNILIEIRQTLEKIRTYSQKIQQKHWLGYSGLPITDIVNIGIGGSDLGPRMVYEALAAFKLHPINCHFVSNADSSSILNVLNHLKPSTTLFIISSKSFRSKETLLNAKTARKWFIETSGCTSFENHFLAVTSMPDLAIAFGIPPQHIFKMWDFVGGRYSVWSAIGGLPIALSIGIEPFEDFLAGAQAMDQHFFSAPFTHNMPILLGLLGIWYINFFGVKSEAILPYCEALKKLPAYLQQAEMESNGKSVSRDGKFIRYQTGPVIFGEVGTNSQHAFHQMLHQGTQIIPVDFILPLTSQTMIIEHQDLLVSSCLSQSRALMLGKSYSDAYHEILSLGYTKKLAKQLAWHKILPGNRPSNTLVLPQLMPYSLGALIALYEHKIFVQSVIWDINCFDQWGIELGKHITDELLAMLKNQQVLLSELDESTTCLLQLYLESTAKDRV
jgi:glucose-6-phosphate isomerase